MPRGKVLIKLDMMVENKQCLFTLAMSTRLSFAYPMGKLFIIKVDANDPVFIMRYKLGEKDHETGMTNIKVIEGDLVESEKKIYAINKVSRCPKERLVFVEATLVPHGYGFEPPKFFPSA